MSGKISDERKMAYYLGNGLSVLGFFLFISSFFVIVSQFGQRSDFIQIDAIAMKFMFFAVGGMICTVAGRFIARIGVRGLAGSGVILDPEQAREDLAPYARMTGGIVKDALDEAQIHLGGNTPERVVMIKCPACGKLNAEDAKFCQECGNAL